MGFLGGLKRHSSPRCVLQRATELTLPRDDGPGELRHDGKRGEAGSDVLDVREVGGGGRLRWGCGGAAELSAALEGTKVCKVNAVNMVLSGRG